jgi:hypothetical protein
VSRKAWILICIAYVLGAGAALAGAVALSVQFDRLDDQQQAIKANASRLAQLAINITAAQCLQAYAPEQPRAPAAGKAGEDEKQLVQDYVHGDVIPLSQYGDVCPRAVALAKAQIAGRAP